MGGSKVICLKYALEKGALFFLLALFYSKTVHAEYIQLDCRRVADDSVQVVLNFDVNNDDAEVQDPSGDIYPAKLKSFPSVLRFSYNSNPLMPIFITIDVSRKDLSMIWTMSVPELQDKLGDVKTDFLCNRVKTDTTDNLI